MIELFIICTYLIALLFHLVYPAIVGKRWREPPLSKNSLFDIKISPRIAVPSHAVPKWGGISLSRSPYNPFHPSRRGNIRMMHLEPSTGMIEGLGGVLKRGG